MTISCVVGPYYFISFNLWSAPPCISIPRMDSGPRAWRQPQRHTITTGFILAQLGAHFFNRRLNANERSLNKLLRKGRRAGRFPREHCREKQESPGGNGQITSCQRLSAQHSASWFSRFVHQEDESLLSLRPAAHNPQGVIRRSVPNQLQQNQTPRGLLEPLSLSLRGRWKVLLNPPGFHSGSVLVSYSAPFSLGPSQASPLRTGMT